MAISLTQILIQNGYLTTEQYNFAYQIQQNQPLETRQPLAQIYLENGFLGVEHIDYCLKIKQDYIQQGIEPDFGEILPEQPVVYHSEQDPSSVQMVNCKVCLSECQAGWTNCPFCGNAL